MSLRDQTYLRVVLYEGNDAEPLDGEQRFQAMSRLLGQGFALTRVGVAGRTAPADDIPAVVLGRFRNGVEQLTSEATSERVKFTNVTGFTDEQIVGAVES